MRRGRTAAFSWLAVLPLLPLAGFAFYYSLRYGLRGFSPAADIVFYGGWQIANGQLPHLDFFVSYGAVQYLIQGALMKLFGPSWLIYCAHAAAFNAIFVCLIYLLLKRFGLSWWIAFAYAWCAGITYYPVIGYPQPDKHSFLFLILALLLQMQVTAESKRRRVFLYYAGAGICYLLALFCKANPTLLYPLAALAVMLGLRREQWMAAVLGGLAALMAALSFGLMLAMGHPGFFADLLYYLVTLPGMIAAGRSGGSWPILKLADYARFPSITLAYAALAAGGAIFLQRLGEAGDERFRRTVLIPLLLAASFVLMTVFHILHIGQPPLAHVTLIVPAIALAHAAFLNGIGEGGALRRARLSLSLLLLVFVAVDVSEYNRIAVKRRLSYDADMPMDGMQERGASGLPELRYVEFIPLTSQPEFLEGFKAILEEVRAVPGNVMTLGLSPWYYVFGQKAPVLPAIYIIPGHSSPGEDSLQETALAARLAANLEKAEVRHLILNPDRFDAAMQALEQEGLACGATNETHFARIDLCQPFRADQVETARALLRLAGP
ncbi:MAG: hypothetical protein OEL53_08000 [Rhodospirillales bacterium]|nr:hypothetical protein [Rhodospirillales bacterium]